jgi:hypothetical protein
MSFDIEELKKRLGDLPNRESELLDLEDMALALIDRIASYRNRITDQIAEIMAGDS